jgi:hypothetical protein
MAASSEAGKLPDSLRRYFWDYGPADVDWSRDRDAVIARLLQSGGLEAARWLRTRLGAAELARWITGRGGRGLSPERMRYWGLVLDLPRELVDRWVAEARATPWGRRAARALDR